jgi:hypothetical protein
VVLTLGLHLGCDCVRLVCDCVSAAHINAATTHSAESLGEQPEVFCLSAAALCCRAGRKQCSFHLDVCQAANNPYGPTSTTLGVVSLPTHVESIVSTPGDY